MTHYRQCELRKGKTHTVSWIPEKYAQKGRVVKLRKRVGGGCVRSHTDWDDGWEVESVGARASEAQVRLMERNHTRTRPYSDI